MSAFKDKNTGKWNAYFRYTDWRGERKQKLKRGFATKREALEWERGFLQQQASDMDMSFKAFVELYSKDMKARLRKNTWQTKENIIIKKLLPYFGNKGMNEISARDIIQWQNEMMNFRSKVSRDELKLS